MKLGKNAWSEMTPGALKKARAALGMTQAELGAALGITGVEVYRKEHGLRRITLQQALAVECLLWRFGYKSITNNRL